MIDTDEIIKEFNKTLEDKINSYKQTHEHTEDNEIPDTGHVDSIKSTLTCINDNVCIIAENDQVRRIKFKANSLLEQLNLPLLEEDKDIELKCFIKGRDCNYNCIPINEEYE